VFSSRFPPLDLRDEVKYPALALLDPSTITAGAAVMLQQLTVDILRLPVRSALSERVYRTSELLVSKRRDSERKDC